jgi:hypothetical protein
LTPSLVPSFVQLGEAVGCGDVHAGDRFCRPA